MKKNIIKYIGAALFIMGLPSCSSEDGNDALPVDAKHTPMKFDVAHPSQRTRVTDTDFEDGYSRSLKEMARENGVVLTGFVKGRKLHSLLTNCLCYCLPSSHEGLPIALLEAMSYGVKVVVSDIPANLEVGLPAADYFPVGDVDALAAKLKAVIEQPLRHIDYDMAKYDWEKIADQVAGVYRQLQ